MVYRETSQLFMLSSFHVVYLTTAHDSFAILVLSDRNFKPENICYLYALLCFVFGQINSVSFCVFIVHVAAWFNTWNANADGESHLFSD